MNEEENPTPVEETPLDINQPRHCTCLYTRPGTFDARTSTGSDYMNRAPSIRDPFCTYNHVKETA